MIDTNVKAMSKPAVSKDQWLAFAGRLIALAYAIYCATSKAGKVLAYRSPR